MATPRLPRRLIVLFALLSGADLALTCHLIGLGEGVYEANGVAAAVLDDHGAAGLAVYKALAVLAVGGLVAFIAARRPRAARGLAGFACAAVAAVLVYSVSLWAGVLARPANERLGLLQAESRRIDAMRQRMAGFTARLERWDEPLASGRCTLREAVEGVLADAGAVYPDVLATHSRHLGAASDVECVAIMLVGRAASGAGERRAAAGRARVQQLLAAYREEFGRPLDTGALAYLTTPLEGPSRWSKGTKGGRPGSDNGRRPPGMKVRAGVE